MRYKFAAVMMIFAGYSVFKGIQLILNPDIQMVCLYAYLQDWRVFLPAGVLFLGAMMIAIFSIALWQRKMGL